nr:putative reverse transcriptase domain-containing protein [Tanacetum cinerariifolium]
MEFQVGNKVMLKVSPWKGVVLFGKRGKLNPRKPKRKNTQVPQTRGSTEHVADEAIYKELDDRLVRAATTTSSLEVEQDNGNINKTQSKATSSEASSLGTTSGGGPRCQDTVRDTIARTRFENVFKLSNYSLLARGEEVFVEKEVADKEGKGIMVEEVVKLKKKDQIRLDEETALKLQAEFNKEEQRFARGAQKELEANISLIETCDDVQAKIDSDY